jgi:hypothetical protein
MVKRLAESVRTDEEAARHGIMDALDASRSGDRHGWKRHAELVAFLESDRAA